jgi:hypothetical protein
VSLGPRLERGKTLPLRSQLVGEADRIFHFERNDVVRFGKRIGIGSA